MSYFRASTANPQGWRPGTVTLGNLVRHNGPDWKDAAAHRDAAMRAGQRSQAGRQRAAGRHASMVDAAARGDRTRVRVARLSGLAGLDLASSMVQGAQYVFHFTYGGLGIRPGMDAVSKAVAADTNFASPAASTESSGVQVRFIYNGRGSTIGNAGAEMQNVINTFSVMGVANSLLFSSAEGGPATSQAPAGVTVLTTSPDGTVIQYSDGSVTDLSTGITLNADGTVRSSGGTPPGDQPPGNNNNSFNWSTFLAGMGLSAGVGTALAIGLGVLLLKD